MASATKGHHSGGIQGVQYTSLARTSVQQAVRLLYEGTGRIRPRRSRKRTSHLYFTTVCRQRTIRGFTVLCYFRVMFGSRCPAEVPESERVWYARVFFRENKRCK
ncbi:unnamed protein product [Ascophyllum nodosum]